MWRAGTSSVSATLAVAKSSGDRFGTIGGFTESTLSKSNLASEKNACFLQHATCSVQHTAASPKPALLACHVPRARQPARTWPTDMADGSTAFTDDLTERSAPLPQRAHARSCAARMRFAERFVLDLVGAMKTQRRVLVDAARTHARTHARTQASANQCGTGPKGRAALGRAQLGAAVSSAAAQITNATGRQQSVAASLRRPDAALHRGGAIALSQASTGEGGRVVSYVQVAQKVLRRRRRLRRGRENELGLHDLPAR